MINNSKSYLSSAVTLSELGWTAGTPSCPLLCYYVRTIAFTLQYIKFATLLQHFEHIREVKFSYVPTTLHRHDRIVWLHFNTLQP